MAANWSEIPEELVYKFMERLVCVDDLIRFGSVCKRWRAISISQKEKKKKKPYSPLMMLANADNDVKDGESARSFLIPYRGANPNKKMTSFDLAVPKAQGRRCWGSPHGWVVTIGLDLDINLLNPLTGTHISLPPQSILQQQCRTYHQFSFTPNLDPDRTIALLIRKLALGWHSSSQSWLVMAIFGTAEQVAFTLTGTENSNSCWTAIDHTIDAEDVILFQDKIYLIAYGGTLKVYDINDTTITHPIATRISRAPDVGNSYTFYLAEFAGHLHFVARYYDLSETDDYFYMSPSGFRERGHKDNDRFVTTGFRVWRFDFTKTEWCELDDLGENALFVGNNTSFAISTITYPDFSKNCVYFTDDRYHTYNSQFCDMGVYDYEEKTVKKPFDITNIANMGEFSEFSRPTFFMPTL